jgi:hypothetical protein
MKQFLFVTLIAFSMQLLAQDKIPAGIILPVQLNSSLRSDKARVGEQIVPELCRMCHCLEVARFMLVPKSLGILCLLDLRLTE